MQSINDVKINKTRYLILDITVMVVSQEMGQHIGIPIQYEPP